VKEKVGVSVLHWSGFQKRKRINYGKTSRYSPKSCYFYVIVNAHLFTCITYYTIIVVAALH